MINYAVLAAYSALAEYMLDNLDDFISSEEELDENIRSDALTEAYAPKDYANGDVYECRFPYLNEHNKAGKVRPCILIKGKQGETYCIPIHHFEESAKLTKYSYKLKHWVVNNPKGLKAHYNIESYVKVSNLIPIETLSYLGKKFFHIDDRDLMEIIKILHTVHGDPYGSPWLLLSWILREAVKTDIKPNKDSFIQKFGDLRKSKKGTSVDLATAFHGICNKMGYSNRIGWIRAYNKDRKEYIDKFYVMFMGNRNKHGNTVFVVRLFDKPPIYQIYKSDCTTFDSATNKEESIFKDKLMDQKIHIGYINSYILSKDEINIWDKYAEKRAKYDDLITSLNGKAYDMEISYLNKKLNAFKWGCFYNGSDHQTEKGCWMKYKTLHPEKFLYYKGGCCWDYTIYEEKYFKDHFPEYKVTCYYWESDRDDGGGPETHAWLTYKKPSDDKTYLFESSMKRIAGVTEYASDDKMLDVYTGILMRSISGGYVVYTFDIDEEMLGIGSFDFMKHIYKKGKLVRDVKGYFDKYIK